MTHDPGIVDPMANLSIAHIAYYPLVIKSSEGRGGMIRKGKCSFAIFDH